MIVGWSEGHDESCLWFKGRQVSLELAEALMVCNLVVCNQGAVTSFVQNRVIRAVSSAG